MKKVLLTATAILALGAINACSVVQSPCEKKIAAVLEIYNEYVALRDEGAKIINKGGYEVQDTNKLDDINKKLKANVAKLTSEHPVESFAEAGCTQEQTTNLGRILMGNK